MKVLLDTNIVIHRETETPVNKEIGHMFRWIDNLQYTKYIHVITIKEIEKLKNKEKLSALKIKLGNYNTLPTTASLDPLVDQLSSRSDVNENDRNDTILLNEVFCDRVDILITEDRKIHNKAAELGIEYRVFTIDAFLEKAISEHPSLTEYPIPLVKKEYFGNIDPDDEFFDTLKERQFDIRKWSFSKFH